jgi:hypothetical protein
MGLIDARICLPELFEFVVSLTDQIDHGIITNWDDFEDQVLTFYNPAQMGKIEEYVPGWGRMASYADGATLIHVTSALVALLQLPEYRSGARSDQQVMQWIILFHDIGKQLTPEGGRDPAHAFRSAILTARGLQHNRFVQADNSELDEFCSLIQSAIKFDPQSGLEIQDNSRLDLIIEKLERLFQHNTPETFILKSVLFHMSLDVVTDWPQFTPLDDTDIKIYLDRDVIPYLRAMMLVDNDAWAMFSREEKKKNRQKTLSVFKRIEKLMDMKEG